MTAIFSNLERGLSFLRLLWGRSRGRVLALRGATIGSKAFVGPRCIIHRPAGVTIGDRSFLEAEVFLKLVSDSALLSLGASTFVGRGVEFDVMESVTIGSNSLIAPRCFITDHGHGSLPDLRIDQQPCKAAPVIIGSDVWLGHGVVVLPGVTIGDGAIVGANSVVTRNVESMTVVAGAPARFVRSRSADVDGS